ncbi:MAG: hypothetical protein ABFD81_19095 [Syntrophaceae bacterium]
MIHLTLVGDKEIAARFLAVSPKLHAELVTTTKVLTLRLLAKIKAEKLSGQVLRNRSNHLRASIHDGYEITEDKVSGMAGTNVVYARIHEYGGVTKPHLIKPRNALALHFVKNGADVFARAINHPGSKIPERSFMRSALNEMHAEIVQGYRAATARALK